MCWWKILKINQTIFGEDTDKNLRLIVCPPRIWPYPTSLPTHYHIPISHLLLKNTYSPGGNTFGIIQLHNIYPTLPINSNYPKAQLTRQEQTPYNRLRIGHTYLTHSYLLKDEDPPICIPCNSLLTVEHILISCIDFDIIRQNFYTASNLKDLFHNVHPKRIISFVHAIGLTNKL